MNEDKATRYHRLKRWCDVAGVIWTVTMLAAAAATGLSRALRELAASTSPYLPAALGPYGEVTAFVVLLSLLGEIGSAPLAFYSAFVLEARYGLSNQKAAGWALDQLKALALGVLIGSVAANVLYFFIRWSPDGWWLPVGAVFAVSVVGLANLAPVLLLPIFYSVKPLTRDDLKARLIALADRAGARVLGAYEWGLAEKTRKANAALTGLGSTRRILVSDTMLAEYSDEEIEVILAHELGHHVHGDIWKGLMFESALILAGCYVASSILSIAIVPLGLTGAADVAGLPALLLAAGAVSLVTVPVAHALSRAYERSADRFALGLTRNPGAFISAMRRLSAQNLAEEHPSRLVQWLFYSHPPIRERIAAAQAFKA